ncbi:zinc-dependent alcohol dehydrogenase [Desulfonema magnum]|uniref:Alcohol dehydrogenase n=1 Tax=Desulfonema magnum TaxID=45655 RepID=A0A975GU85_9BACT|nr:zinc-binding dehydrogenase [Desulfonema magnum]QTA92923.1 Alcohol dehydrogenase [Desulfonema magnum]
MKKFSRAMVLTGPRKMEMQTFHLPEIGENDGLLEVELAGVCGSDPGIYRGVPTHGPRPFPLIMGHEIVGRVAKMGKTAQKRLGVAEGDRVVIEYAFGCGMCESCLTGAYSTCENKYFYGSMISCLESPHLFGAYSEYLYIHPQAKVHKIGDEISPEIGVLICAVLGNGIRWLRRIGGVSVGDTVAIIGPGQQGLAAAAVARESGANPIYVIGLSRDKDRLDMARRFGAHRTINADEENPWKVISDETHGRLADVVTDLSGNPAGAELALSLAGKKATVVLPGIYKGKKATLNLDHAVLNEIKIFGAYSQNFQSVRAAIKMVCQARYPFEEMITHRFPLKDAEQAVRMAAGEEKEIPVKVVIEPWN